MTLSNNPPPEAAFGMAIDDLVAEAANFLDGAEIETQGQADALGKLAAQIRDIAKDADKARAAEKKPHDDAGKAVQVKWKPIIDKANLAAETAKAPITRWLRRVEEKQRVEATRKRQEADQAAAKVRELAQTAPADDLNARLDLAAAEHQAQQAAKDADKAEKQKAQVAGGARATALRTYWNVDLIDPVEALKWCKQRHPDDLKAFLLEQAEKDVRTGTRSIPGFEIKEERKAA